MNTSPRAETTIGSDSDTTMKGAAAVARTAPTCSLFMRGRRTPLNRTYYLRPRFITLAIIYGTPYCGGPYCGREGRRESRVAILSLQTEGDDLQSLYDGSDRQRQWPRSRRQEKNVVLLSPA